MLRVPDMNVGASCESPLGASPTGTNGLHCLLQAPILSLRRATSSLCSADCR
jgi:hypothetical protein